MSTTLLQRRIMRRVYLIWAGRLIVNRFTIKLGVFAVLLWQFAALVFVAAVFANAEGAAGADMLRYMSYIVGAFFETDILVKTTLVGMAIIGGWLAMDTYRNIRPLLGSRALS